MLAAVQTLPCLTTLGRRCPPCPAAGQAPDELPEHLPAWRPAWRAVGVGADIDSSPACIRVDVDEPRFDRRASDIESQILARHD